MGDNLEVYSLNLASSCLSVFGSAAIIINYIFFANKTQPLYKLILFLSVADFGGSLFISISQILLFLHHFDDLPYGIDLCRVLRAFINFFFVSSFFWTSAIALHIYVSSRQKAQIPLYWFHMVCWGLPGIGTVIVVAAGMITQEKDGAWCSLNPLGHWLFWYGPLLVSFVWNIVLYILIIRFYRGGQGAERKMMKNKIKVRVTLYILVFFICWVWDLVDFVAYELHHPNFWLDLLTSTFMPLQGFLNFLVYGVSSRMFRHRTGPKSPLRQQAINAEGERRRLLTSDVMYS